MATHHSYDIKFATTAQRLVRQCVKVSTDQGRVTQFSVQLAYQRDVTSNEWETIVQFDHASREDDTPRNDVTKAGLQVEIYGGGEPIATHTLTPQMPANAALNAAYIHLWEQLGVYVERYEQWHGIDQNQTPTAEVEMLREDLENQRIKIQDHLDEAGVDVSAWRFTPEQD